MTDNRMAQEYSHEERERLAPDLALALARFSNYGMLKIDQSKQFVAELMREHRTLQAGVMNFMLACVIEYGLQTGRGSNRPVDLRNATISASCEKIASLWEEGEAGIEYNPFI